MWIVTGGAGFIGSAMLWKLNQEGIDNILVVDRLDSTDKWKNLIGKRFADYLEADDFVAALEAGKLRSAKGIIHFGACSSTTETNASFLIKNNYEYTKRLAIWALAHKKPFLYASSAATYGDGALGYTTDDATTEKLRPLNMYGYSKHLFDLWALREGVAKKLTGIKFFNVFGPNEYHKGDMRSVVCKAYEQIKKDGKIRLFKSYRSDYRDGEQQRDFFYVKDAVQVVWELMKNKNPPAGKQGPGGLYNFGAGLARSWNDLAHAIFRALGKTPNIEYIDMPETLRPKYQYHTKADMSWRKSGKPLMSLEEGVADYVQNYLAKENPYL